MSVERKGGREGLFLEAAEISDIDGIDIPERDTGMFHRRPSGAGDQRLEALILELAEFGMRPTNDRGHL